MKGSALAFPFYFCLRSIAIALLAYEWACANTASAIIRAMNPPSLWRTTSLLTLALAAAVAGAAALAGGDAPASDGLQLNDQTIAGFVAPGRVLVADGGSSRFGLGLTQAGNRFNMVLPGATELSSALQAPNASNFAFCKEIVVSPSNVKVAAATQMLVLNTTDPNKQRVASISGKLVLADSLTSAKAIGGNTPPDQGRYLIYIYASVATTVKGECAAVEGSEPPIKPSVDLMLKPGWNQTELLVQKTGEVFDLILKNPADTSGIQWYFVKYN
jgi:hypothetical protein